MVKTSADSLLQVINDILDFSKIEAGKLELDPTPFALAGQSRCGRQVRWVSGRTRKGLELICHVAPDSARRLVGDSLRLRQVVINLVGNAIKFTDRGEVVVQVDVEADVGRSGLSALHRARHRHRHPAGKAACHLRGIHASRCLDDAQLRRHRLGSGHHVATGRADGRSNLGRKRTWHRQHLPFHRSTRKTFGHLSETLVRPRGPGATASPDRRRQCHQPCDARGDSHELADAPGRV